MTLENRWSLHVEPVRSTLEVGGHLVGILTVPYEFQRAEGQGGSRMMRIKASRLAPPAGRT